MNRERMIQPVKSMSVEVEELYVEMPSGLLVPSDIAPEFCAPVNRPLALDLFAGCGGMSCGFHQAGWHVVAASEWEPTATHTYLTNLGSPETEIHFASDEDHQRWDAYCKKNKVATETFGTGWISSRTDHAEEDCKGGQVDSRAWFHETYCGGGQDISSPPCEHFFFGDIRKLACKAVLDAIGMEPGDLDCIAGGPPCQGYSTAGKQQIMDPRNSLVFEFCRMIVGLQPKTMLFENVPGIVNMVTPEGVTVIDAICLYLSKGGYSTVDALKRSLAGMPNARGAVRRTGRSEKEESRTPKKSKDQQVEMAI